MRRPKKKVYDYKKALRAEEKTKKESKNSVDSTPKDEVKEMFMAWFRKNPQVGQIMSKQNVVKDILTKLDKRQNNVLEIAMNDLKSAGFIETQEDGVTLVLTQKGFDSLN